MNRNLSYVELRDQKTELSHPGNNRALREEERLLFFPGKVSVSESLWTLYNSVPPSFSSLNAFFPLPMGYLHSVNPMAHHGADPELQFSADPEQTCLCWGNICQSICFRSIFLNMTERYPFLRVGEQQFQETKQPNQKMGQRTKQTFLQRRQTDG